MHQRHTRAGDRRPLQRLSTAIAVRGAHHPLALPRVPRRLLSEPERSRLGRGGKVGHSKVEGWGGWRGGGAGRVEGLEGWSEVPRGSWSCRVRGQVQRRARGIQACTLQSGTPHQSPEHTNPSLTAGSKQTSQTPRRRGATLNICPDSTQPSPSPRESSGNQQGWEDGDCDGRW
jgi:hypothetical protein